MTRSLVWSFAALLVASISAQADQLAWAEDLSAPDDTIYQFTDVRVIGGDVYLSGYTRARLAGFVWKRSGGVWTDLNISSVSLVDTIHGTSGSDLWVGGNSGVHHYDGGAWSPVAAGVGGEVKNIASIDASGTNFVDIAYLWDGFAAARDVVVDRSGDAWFCRGPCSRNPLRPGYGRV